MPQRSETELPEPSQLLRFRQAGAHAGQLRMLSALAGAGAVALLYTAWALFVNDFNRIWPSVLRIVSAALLTLLIGFYSALQVSLWRQRSLGGGSDGNLAPPTAPRPVTWDARLNRWLRQLARRYLRTLAREDLITIAVALLALYLVRRGWNLDIAGAALHRPGYAASGLALAGAYGLLVLERHLSARSPREWPEAPILAQLLRPTIFIFVVAALCLAVDAPSRIWPARLMVVCGLIPAAVAAELLIRAIFAAIARAPDPGEPPMLAKSLIASSFVWPPRPWALVHEELRGHFGIDLRQNWAFHFLRRSSLPVLAAITFVGWLSTGLHELPVASRAIYERLGRPVSVWNPGMHWGLPWPIAGVLPVDYGVVHELVPTISEGAVTQLDQGTADGPAPASSNRLWDVSHTGDNAQIISSEVGGKQNFQLVNMDVLLVYRIGLDPEAAMASVYHCADLKALIRSTANRVMLQYFASRTLDGLLGAQRDVLARDIKRAVQAQLDRFGSGVELLSVLVESIHPPAGAAAAYHAVQAAVISSQAIVAAERGAAADTLNDAQLTATSQVDSATAAGRENTVAAQVTQLGADAELKSYQAAGSAFLRERYLEQLAAGLSKADLVIIDHRIAVGSSAPTIDLRNLSQNLPPSVPPDVN